MSLLINKINKGNKGGAFLRFIRLAFFLLVLFGPVVAASMFDLSNCQGLSRWIWIAAFCILFFLSFQILENKYDKKGKHVFTVSFLMGFVWQLLLFIPFILITHPEGAQVWNCARSIATAAGLAAICIVIESLENRLAKRRVCTTLSQP